MIVFLHHNNGFGLRIEGTGGIDPRAGDAVRQILGVLELDELAATATTSSPAIGQAGSRDDVGSVRRGYRVTRLGGLVQFLESGGN